MMAFSSTERWFLSFIGATVLLGGCNGMHADVGARGTNTDMLTDDIAAPDLVVGNFVHVSFSASTPSSVTEVLVFDGPRAGPGRRHGFGPGHMGGGPPPGGPGMMPPPPPSPESGEAPPADDLASRGMLRGTVEAVDVDSGTLTLLGGSVATDASTRFLGVASLSELEVGSGVDVHGRIQTDGTYVAVMIRVARPELAGVISAVTPGATEGTATISVLGRSVALGVDTKITKISAPPRHGAGAGRRHRPEN